MFAGVISDTHGNHEFMLRAAGCLEEMGAEVLLHLGDDEADARNGFRLPLYSVPGKYEPAYADPSNRTRTLEFAGAAGQAAHQSLRSFSETVPPGKRSDGYLLTAPASCRSHARSSRNLLGHPCPRAARHSTARFRASAGLPVRVAHMMEDLPMAGIRLYGHTHRPAVEISGGTLLLCPGHLKAPEDRSVPASFALLSLEESAASARIFALMDNRVIVEATLKKG